MKFRIAEVNEGGKTYFMVQRKVFGLIWMYVKSRKSVNYELVNHKFDKRSDAKFYIDTQLFSSKQKDSKKPKKTIKFYDYPVE